MAGDKDLVTKQHL